nr:hypothetical protein [uncultured Bacillus sp.]
MNMYEIILNMIDKHGPVTIPSICIEINQNPEFIQKRKKPVQPSQIKSVINRKRDLFLLENEIVSLLPNKELLSLTFNMAVCRGPWVQVKVDFIKKVFTYFELNFESERTAKTSIASNPKMYDIIETGNIDDFKQELYRLKIWNWNSNYEQSGIILDGVNWSLRLETKAAVYKSEGYQCFPKNWFRFCHSLSMYIGKKLI